MAVIDLFDRQAQIGFQQLSELKPVKGIDIVGLIPAEAQKMTMYSGAVVSKSQHHAAAQALLDYLASPCMLGLRECAHWSPSQTAFHRAAEPT